jgi:hypothetical protein
MKKAYRIVVGKSNAKRVLYTWRRTLVTWKHAVLYGLSCITVVKT